MDVHSPKNAIFIGIDPYPIYHSPHVASAPWKLQAVVALSRSSLQSTASVWGASPKTDAKVPQPLPGRPRITWDGEDGWNMGMGQYPLKQ